MNERLKAWGRKWNVNVNLGGYVGADALEELSRAGHSKEGAYRERWNEGFARGLSAGQDYTHREVLRQAEFLERDWSDSDARASEVPAAEVVP